MAVNKLASDVFSRARRNLNDDQVSGGRWATDALLLPHLLNAYDWLQAEIASVVPFDLRKRIQDLAYVANTTVLDNLAGWPTDIWMPETINYRKNTSERYVELGRVDDLGTLPAGTTTDRLRSWTWRNRQVETLPASETGLIQLNYLSILAALTGPSSPLLIDFAVTALAYWAAGDARGTRGQREEAKEMRAWGQHFADKIVDIQVRNQQFVARRGQPEHGGSGGHDYNYPSGVI